MAKAITEKRQIIASRPAIARKRAGLSQSQVALKIGLQRPAISEIEAERRRVAAEELAFLRNCIPWIWIGLREVVKKKLIR